MAARKVRRRNRRLSLIPGDRYYGSLLPPLPSSPFIGLPIRQLEPPRLAIRPNAARRGQRVIIVAVEDQHHPFVAVAIGRQSRIVDQEPDIGPVRIAVLDRENDGLVLRIAGAPGGVRQERIVAVGPQMRIERLGALRRGRLHDHAPAALERFFQERRQYAFERHALQMIEQDFRHPPATRITWWLRNIPRPTGPEDERRTPTPNCG